MPLKINKPAGAVGKATQFDKHLTATPAVGTVHAEKVVKQGGAEHTQTLLDSTELVHPGITLPAEDMCKITVEGGQTINLGNYESARINVSLTMPCGKDDIEETFEFVSNWIDTKIAKAIKDSKG